MHPRAWITNHFAIIRIKPRSAGYFHLSRLSNRPDMVCTKIHA